MAIAPQLNVAAALRAGRRAPASLGQVARRARRNPTVVPVAVLWTGLAPLVLLAVVAAVGGVGGLDRTEALTATIGLAAVTLSFLAGIRFGMAMRVGVSAVAVQAMAAAALPAALGWIATLLAPTPALCLLAAAFAGQGAWDVWTTDSGGAPAWYGRARLRFTVAATLVLAALAIVQGAG